MREWERLSDAECSEVSLNGQPSLCISHNQTLRDCTKQRLAQVKAAREMADRRTRWAVVWKEAACKVREELNRWKTMDSKKSV